MYKQVIGNLFDSDAKYLVHQTNCVSVGSAAGLARILFDNYPYADCYKNRTKESIPGTLDIRGNGKDKRYVVNLMGQYYPGSSVNKYDKDNASVRIKYFLSGLVRLSEIKNLQSVAFPAGIGCAIAGGDWEIYSKHIYDFYKFVNKEQNVDIFVYCLPSNVNQFKFKETEVSLYDHSAINSGSY